MFELQKREALYGVLHMRAGSVPPVASTENERKLTFTIVSPDNDGMRYDWGSGESYVERLDAKGAKTDRLNTFFKDHNRGVDDAIGRVESVRMDGDSLKADVIFGSDADSIMNKYRERVLTDVSIGYVIQKYEVEERDGEPDLVTVTEFDIYELSAVGIGFDRGAKHERAMDDVITQEQLRDINIRLDRVTSILTGERK